MNNWTKVLIGVGAVAAVATTAYILTKKDEKQVETVEVVEDIQKEDLSIIDRIKKAALKKAVKILAWVMLHQQQIEAVATILGVFGAVFNVVNAVRDYKNGADTQKKIDKLLKHQELFQTAWNGTIDNYDGTHQKMMDKLNDIHLDLSMLHEVHEAICTPIVRKKKSA